MAFMRTLGGAAIGGGVILIAIAYWIPGKTTARAEEYPDSGPRALKVICDADAHPVP